MLTLPFAKYNWPEVATMSRAEIEELKRSGAVFQNELLVLYEAVDALSHRFKIDSIRPVLDTLADRMANWFVRCAKYVAVDGQSGEVFVDSREELAAFIAQTEELVRAFRLYHRLKMDALDDRSEYGQAHDTFYRLLEPWVVSEAHLRERAHQLATKWFFEELPKVLPPDPEDAADLVPLSDELDRADVLYMPAPRT